MNTKYILGVIILLLNGFLVKSQDTNYLDFTFYKVDNIAEAQYKSVRFTHPKNSKIDIEEVFYISGELYSRSWIRKADNADNLLFKRIFYKNKQLKEDLKFNTYGFNGDIKTYWEDGTLKRHDIFKNGELVQGKCFDEYEQEIEHTPLKFTASFPGGADSLNLFVFKNLHYPEEAESTFQEGTVIISFLVDTAGNLNDIKYTSSGNSSLDAEALRVVSLMPRWKPSVYDGKKIYARIVLPIRFEMPHDSTW